MEGKIHELFRIASRKTSAAAASVWTFTASVLSVVIWAALGPAFNYSTNWQLVINTGTTIITFLMIFLVHNAQSREAKTTQLKLDELVRAMETARNTLLDLDHLSDADLVKLEEDIKARALKADGKKV